MPAKGTKAAKVIPPSTSKSSITKSAKTVAPARPTVPDYNKFPLAQYASVLGVHLLLVGFTTLYLPQTTRLFAPLDAQKTDRPQSEFMEALTADPLATVSWIAAGLVLLQTWWAGWVRTWSFEQTTKGSEAEIKLERVRFDGLRFTRLKNATMFTLCVTIALYVVLVMFGAPISTHIWQTGLLAFIIAILTAFTPAFVLGPPSLSSDTPSLINRLTWTRLFAELTPKNAIEYAIVCPAVGTFVGSWLGAIPIALDWDRPWQAWPLTPLLGSIGGYSIGALVAFASNTAGWLVADHIQPHLSKPKSS